MPGLSSAFFVISTSVRSISFKNIRELASGDMGSCFTILTYQWTRSRLNTGVDLDSLVSPSLKANNDTVIAARPVKHHLVIVCSTLLLVIENKSGGQGKTRC